MKLKVLNIDGAKVSDIELSDQIFWYKAESHPDFRIGADSFWQYSKNIEFISETFAAPGYSSEVCSVFTAKELFLSPLKPDLDEHIEIISIKIKNIPDLIKQGKILDQMSITSLLMASKFLAKWNIF